MARFKLSIAQLKFIKTTEGRIFFAGILAAGAYCIALLLFMFLYKNVRAVIVSETGADTLQFAAKGLALRFASDGDDPHALHAGRADILHADVESSKFGRKYAGGVHLYETGIDSKAFKEETIRLALTLTGTPGRNRTAGITGAREGITIDPAVLPEGPADTFTGEGITLVLLPADTDRPRAADDPKVPHTLLCAISIPNLAIVNDMALLIETGPGSGQFANTIPANDKVTAAKPARADAATADRETAVTEQVRPDYRKPVFISARLTGNLDPLDQDVFEVTVEDRTTGNLAMGMLNMIWVHFVIGRAGGINIGLAFHLSGFNIVFNCIFIDLLAVLILFPVFVFGYRYAAKKFLFKDMIDASVDVANQYQGKLAKYGWLEVISPKTSALLIEVVENR
ncbi:MAG: hypothetical protein ABIF71_06335 [Planctomycetota bacterium]